MSTESNVEAQQAFGQQVNDGTLEFDGLAAPDSVVRDLATVQVPGPEGYRALFTDLRTAFPDLHLEAARS